jgi:hypothetical protein
VTLTHADLEAVGLEGFANSMAGHFSPEDDIAYLADTLGRDADEIRSILTAAGYGSTTSGSYLVTQSVPSDLADRSSLPARDIEIAVYPFADTAGAQAGYQLITDESGSQNSEDVTGTITIGDASELTRISGESDVAWGQPYRQLELEFLRDCLVVALSVYNYGPDAAQPEVAEIEALAGQLLPRVEAVVAGRTPGLDALMLRLQTEPNSASFVVYEMLDAEAVRMSTLTDQAFAERVDTWEELGFTSALRRETPLRVEGGVPDGDLMLYDSLLHFPDEAAASGYMEVLPDRFTANPAYLEVTELTDLPDLGDDSLALALTREADGVRWTLNQVFVRVDDTVAVMWIEKPFSEPGEGPEVGVAPVAELAAAQAACLEADGACSPAPIPTGLSGATATPVASPTS